jgi:hypothetical protein
VTLPEFFPGRLESPLAKHFRFLVIVILICVCIALFCIAKPDASFAYRWLRPLTDSLRTVAERVNVECSAVETYCGTTRSSLRERRFNSFMFHSPIIVFCVYIIYNFCLHDNVSFLHHGANRSVGRWCE